ncbi:CPBP family intramembrane glutamic endopeptidase [Occallatibacter riparius]|uniref:CPBP family intramembrane metalloprotease n=1 Tax=Occallatibacter riparius TaxID=1002689 RepID=A0A9J7BPT3_9BACT|nr:CPBP family intramembrane glutamic endopeptidase [Occallatibacter riparius]UWZ84720.1 CPBP family intramembrane metalloprotease [Occallatibacter riparius]
MLDATAATSETAAPVPAVPAGLEMPSTPAEAALAPPAKPVRIPHLGHVALLGAVMLGGLFAAIIVIFAAVYLRAFGVSKIEDAMHSMAYAVGTMAIWYLVAFAPAVAIFPSLWGKSFLAGLQWNASTARRRWPLLMATGASCFLLAFAAKALLHFPDHSPISGLLTTPQAVWIMFGFAVTVAPLCEEIMFRGFLLPALSTAFDWLGERITKRAPRPLAENGHPQWSLPAMILASVVTSAIFAVFHLSQNGNALGPMVLIFTVSLILCAVRLGTRSLAASALTHATYNFTLFLVMAIGTRGFTHLHP